MPDARRREAMDSDGLDGCELVVWLSEVTRWSDGRIALELRKHAVKLGLFPKLEWVTGPDQVTVWRWRTGKQRPGRFHRHVLRSFAEVRRREFLQRSIAAV